MIRDLDARSVWLHRNVLPHESALRAWLQSRNLCGLEVDDVIQETYSRLITAQSVEHVRNCRTYAFQTAHSVIVDHARRLKVVSFTAVSDLDIVAGAAEDPSPETFAADRDELRRLAIAIAALPNKVQAVFRLRRVIGLSQRDVAARLGISESTVEKHMSRAFLLMLNLFERSGKASGRSSMVKKPSLRRGNGEPDRTPD